MELDTEQLQALVLGLPSVSARTSVRGWTKRLAYLPLNVMCVASWPGDPTLNLDPMTGVQLQPLADALRDVVLGVFSILVAVASLYELNSRRVTGSAMTIQTPHDTGDQKCNRRNFI